MASATNLKKYLETVRLGRGQLHLVALPDEESVDPLEIEHAPRQIAPFGRFIEKGGATLGVVGIGGFTLAILCPANAVFGAVHF
jgi:hypothetical protein